MAVVPGEGTILSVGTTSTVAAIAQINSISFGPIEQAVVDAFSLDSTLKITRPSRMPDPGSMNVGGYLDAANTQHTLIEDSASDHSVLYWKVTTVDGYEYTFQGFVSSFEYNGMETDSNVGFDLEVKLTTLITKTAPTP